MVSWSHFFLLFLSSTPSTDSASDDGLVADPIEAAASNSENEKAKQKKINEWVRIVLHLSSHRLALHQTCPQVHRHQWPLPIPSAVLL